LSIGIVQLQLIWGLSALSNIQPVCSKIVEVQESILFNMQFVYGIMWVAPDLLLSSVWTIDKMADSFCGSLAWWAVIVDWITVKSKAANM